MQRLFSVVFLLIVLLPVFGNLMTETTVAANYLGPMSSLGVANFLPADQSTTLAPTSTSTSPSTVSTSSTLTSTTSVVTTSSSSATSTSSGTPTTTSSTQMTSSSIMPTTSVTSTTSVTTSSSQATTLTSTSSVSSTTSVAASSTDPVTVPSISLSPSSGSPGTIIGVSGSGFSTSDTACSISGRVVASQACSISGGTLTATAFTVANVAGGSYNVKVTGTPSENSASAQFTVSATLGYSISFSPPYWFCTDSYVTFTGPLLESGYFGDTLQFQYYQYDPNLPSALNLIFTDAPLTVTSDSVSYWIHYPEYAPVNFAYMPYLAVRVVDVTPKSNGNIPGLIFMQLTNISPESFQSCQVDSPISTPEFQLQWVVVMISLAAGSLFVKTRFSREGRSRS